MVLAVEHPFNLAALASLDHIKQTSGKTLGDELGFRIITCIWNLDTADDPTNIRPR
jgi:hypothetical protein